MTTGCLSPGGRKWVNDSTCLEVSHPVPLLIPLTDHSLRGVDEVMT